MSATRETIPFYQTNHGFMWGAVEVIRVCSEDKRGAVWIDIETPKHLLQVYVTKTGKVRVYDDNREWKPD